MSIKRKANWTEVETVALVDAITVQLSVIEGRLSPSLTLKVKNEAWDVVVSSVNSQSLVSRTSEEVKKKWADLKSNTKKKERERRKLQKETGGGPAPDQLKDWEEKIVGILREVVLEGINGGVDSFGSDEEPISTCMNDKSSCPVEDEGEKEKQLGACDCTQQLLKLEEDKLRLKKEFLQLKKEKLNFLKQQEKRRSQQHQETNEILNSIAQSLSENPNCNFLDSDIMSVSPVIKLSKTES